jgi:hypothetical protein
VISRGSRHAAAHRFICWRDIAGRKQFAAWQVGDLAIKNAAGSKYMAGGVF